MKASERYTEIEKELQANLQLLKEKLENHKTRFENDNGNWSYVGDISYINTQISNIVNR